MCIFMSQRSPRKGFLKGFSIGETVLSAFVLTTGLLAVSGLVTTSMDSSFTSRDAIIATALAQEGVELVRNVRDNDFAIGGTGFASFSNANKHCRIDYNDPITSLNCQASQGAASRYTLQYSGGFYQYNNTADEKFSRYIFVDYNGSTTALVRSFVYWGTYTPPATGNSSDCNSANDCVFTEVNLMNWK